MKNKYRFMLEGYARINTTTTNMREKIPFGYFEQRSRKNLFISDIFRIFFL